MPLTTPQQRILTWLALAVVAGLLLHVFGAALSTLALAFAAAYVLWPLVLLLQRRGLSRSAATGISVLGGMVVAAALVMMLVPIVTTLIPKLQAQWPGMLDRFDRSVTPRLAEWGIHLDVATVKAEAQKEMDGNMQQWMARLLSSLRIGGSWLLTIAGGLVLVPMLVFYMLVEAESLGRALPTLVPLRVRASVVAFARDCDVAMRGYLRAQLLVMAAMAAFYALGLALVGLDLAAPIGIFTGLAVFIPYLGYGTGLALALLTAAIQFASWGGIAEVAAVYAAGQVLESFFLTPRLVGGRIGLSPLGVIVVLLLAGEAFGFVGVLLSLPASAIGMVAAHRLATAWRASEFYRA